MSQHQTQKTTSDTTSQTSKNGARKKTEHAPAAAAFTAEDAAFEASLQANVEPEPDIERGPDTTLRKEKVSYTLLSDIADDVRPAKTHGELLEQIHLAKQMGADSIEAEPTIVRQLTLKSGYPDDVGYLWYSDVRVWIAGFFETHADKDRMSIETKVFGSSKHKIQPVMDLGERQK